MIPCRKSISEYFVMPASVPNDLSGRCRKVSGSLATRRRPVAFLKLARSGAKWSPGWPRRLKRLAAERNVTFDAPQYFDLLSAGFRGNDRPRRLVRALLVIFRARHPQGRAGYIYEGRDLLVFGEDVPRRYGPPESALRPSWHVSPIGLPPAVDMPEPAMPEPPVAAPLTRPPRGTIVER